MKFEYDSNKSSINTEKHDIDFDHAKDLWQDEKMFEVPLNFPDELRIEEKHYSAVITYHDDTIRIISGCCSSSDHENVFSATFRKSGINLFP
jgi:hypothetical protein